MTINLPATIYLALGSNLGDRVCQPAGSHGLPSRATSRVLERRPVYETPPWGFIDQPAFLNMAAQGRDRPWRPVELLIPV